MGIKPVYLLSCHRDCKKSRDTCGCTVGRDYEENKIIEYLNCPDYGIKIKRSEREYKVELKNIQNLKEKTSKIDKNYFAEMHRTQLKEALTELLERVDEIVDTAYSNQTLNVYIGIEIQPCELVTYNIDYKCFAKSIEAFGMPKESEGNTDDV